MIIVVSRTQCGFCHVSSGQLAFQKPAVKPPPSTLTALEAQLAAPSTPAAEAPGVPPRPTSARSESAGYFAGYSLVAPTSRNPRQSLQE